MTMRDNVEVAKESAEKSKRIEKLEEELAFADWFLGTIIRRSCQRGLLEVFFTGPVDSPAP